MSVERARVPAGDGAGGHLARCRLIVCTCRAALEVFDALR
jgi:hypothetical protein